MANNLIPIRVKNITGKRFNNLIVLGFAYIGKYNTSYWKVKCNCGVESIVNGQCLKRGDIKKCICIKYTDSVHHGMSASRTYNIWSNMKARCNNPNAINYKDYGARGIKICRPWIKFNNFLENMGTAPDNMTLDRIDPDGNYEPKNCRWATYHQQAINKRPGYKPNITNKKINHKSTKIKPIQKKYIDIKGRKFSRLFVFQFSHMDKYRYAYWIVRCDCGNQKIVSGNSLRSGHTKSCGCLKNTHGLRNTRTYRIWAGMKNRCIDKRNQDYGGRGISVCESWLQFENFLKDMGEAPPQKSLERIDSNGDYKLNNCKWATKEEQANNKRTSIKIRYRGIIKTISQWGKIFNIDSATLFDRIFKRNWDLEKAFHESVKIKYRNRYAKTILPSNQHLLKGEHNF